MKDEPREPDDEPRRAQLKALFKAARRGSVADSVRREWRQLGAEAQPLLGRERISFEPGHIFGRYRLLAEVGRGGMGVVYRAHDALLARTVAVKIYGRELAGSSQSTLERFTQEARATARLSHPGVVRIYDAGQVDDVPFLSMDCVEGESLEQVFWQLSLEERVRHLGQVARALEHAHAHGIVHRDVKPSNVLIDPDGQAVLVDFGIARDLTRQLQLTTTGQLVGTVAYMSPEQLRGEPKRIGPASDVYSLGVLLYQAIYEELPHTGAQVEMMVGILNHDPHWPEAPTSAGRRLQPIARRCLHKEAADRYPSAGDLASDLERLLAGLEPREEAEPSSQAPAPPRRRGPPQRSGGRARPRPPSLATKLRWLAVAGLALAGLCGLSIRSPEVEAPPAATASTSSAESTAALPPPRTVASLDALPYSAPRLEVAPEIERASASPVRSISGRVSGSSRARLTLDGESVRVTASGSFSAEVTLDREGETTVELEARDEEGGVVTRALSLRLDTTPPAVRVLAPQVAVVASASLTLRGAVEAADLARLLVDGRPVEVDRAGQFEAALEFGGEGPLETLIEAYDRAGNRTRLVHRITYDATPPRLVLDAPTEGQLTAKRSVTVRGRVTDLHLPPAVSVREEPTGRLLATAALRPGGRFEVEVPLPSGPTRLVVRCTDGAGNTASLGRAVVSDTRAPRIRLADALPTEVFGRRSRRLRLQGVVDDALSSLSLNGRAVSVSSQGRFRCYLKLSEGRNAVELAAVDRAGNRGVVSGVVRYGRRRPSRPAQRTLLRETFSAPPTAYALQGTLLEGLGICRSDTAPTKSGKYMNKVCLTHYEAPGLFTYEPGATLRFRIRLSKPLKGAFKLQLWSREHADNYYLYPATPRAGEWVAVEIDLGQVRLHSKPQFAKEFDRLEFSSLALLVGGPGEDVAFEVDDLIVQAPTR